MLNKHNLSIRRFAPKEESRWTLQGIQITPQYTVVTNGHYLVKVTTPKVKVEDYPLNARETLEGFKPSVDFKPFILPTDAAKEIEKAIPKHKLIPILNHAAIDGPRTDGNGSATITTTDLENTRVFTPHKIEGQFPNWEMVVPKDEPKVTFAVDASYLAKIADAAAKFSSHSNKRVKITIYGENTAIRFDVENHEQEMMALLMPVR